MDCKGCHKETGKSVGPAYLDVAKKYLGNKEAMSYLAAKISKGGSGVWGEVAMPAHPTTTQDDVRQIVSWILSLANTGTVQKSLPASGTIIPPANQKPGSVMVLTASYTDKGGNNIKALTGHSNAALSGNTVAFTGKEKVSGFSSVNYGGATLMLLPAGDGWFSTADVDLTGVRVINLSAGWRDTLRKSIPIEARLDAPDGKLLGKGSMPVPKPGDKKGIVRIPIELVPDGKKHEVYFVYKGQGSIVAVINSLQFNSK